VNWNWNGRVNGTVEGGDRCRRSNSPVMVMTIITKDAVGVVNRDDVYEDEYSGLRV